tara:strand:- start:2583 stop:3227 length:645 start_codon:yes stop_codon:yes gene_type:complete
MKNNYRIINFLRKLFKVLYWFAVVNLLVGTLMNFMGLIFADFPMAYLKHFYFISEAKFSADVSYNLFGGGFFNGESEVFMRLTEIQSDEFSYRLFGFVDTTFVMTCTLFLFKNAHELFDNLTNSFKSGENFSLESYKNIRTIGFWLLGFWLYGLINGILFSLLLLNNLVVQGIQLNLRPEWSELGNLIIVLIIFAFAEVYRSGIVMQEESELTI